MTYPTTIPQLHRWIIPFLPIPSATWPSPLTFDLSTSSTMRGRKSLAIPLNSQSSIQNITQLSSKYWECTILGRRMSPPSSWSKSSPRPIPQPAHKPIRVEGRICGIMTHQHHLLRGKRLGMEVGRLKVGMEWWSTLLVSHMDHCRNSKPLIGKGRCPLFVGGKNSRLYGGARETIRWVFPQWHKAWYLPFFANMQVHLSSIPISPCTVLLY